jgi:hypothetical protein
MYRGASLDVIVVVRLTSTISILATNEVKHQMCKSQQIESLETILISSKRCKLT